MRGNRVIALLATVILALGLALSAPGAAHAAKDKRDVKSLQAGEIRNTGRFYAKGQIGDFRERVIKLQRRNCDKCNWKPFRKQRTGTQGRFHFKFDGPTGSSYRLFIPAGSEYQTFQRYIGKIVRR